MWLRWPRVPRHRDVGRTCSPLGGQLAPHWLIPVLLSPPVLPSQDPTCSLETTAQQEEEQEAVAARPAKALPEVSGEGHPLLWSQHPP